MKHHASFSSNDKSEKKKAVSSAAILLGALRVNLRLYLLRVNLVILLLAQKKKGKNK